MVSIHRRLSLRNIMTKIQEIATFLYPFLSDIQSLINSSHQVSRESSIFESMVNLVVKRIFESTIRSATVWEHVWIKRTMRLESGGFELEIKSKSYYCTISFYKITTYSMAEYCTHSEDRNWRWEISTMKFDLILTSHNDPLGLVFKAWSFHFDNREFIFFFSRRSSHIKQRVGNWGYFFLEDYKNSNGRENVKKLFPWLNE